LPIRLHSDHENCRQSEKVVGGGGGGGIIFVVIAVFVTVVINVVGEVRAR
jgi:hypothetical protein